MKLTAGAMGEKPRNNTGETEQPDLALSDTCTGGLTDTRDDNCDVTEDNFDVTEDITEEIPSVSEEIVMQREDEVSPEKSVSVHP